MLNAIHKDFLKLSEDNSEGKTRKGDYTSENLLRALVIFIINGEDFRDTACRIAESPFLVIVQSIFTTVTMTLRVTRKQ
ncbi:MAG: hypothetical protein V1899_10285 [Planctomycetota bacterium]